MADWRDNYQEALDFEESIIGRPSHRSRKPEILLSQQLWEDIKAYNAMDAGLAVEMKAAMDIAEDDRRADG